MLQATRTDETLLTQLCEHQPEAIAWFTPVYGNDNGSSTTIIDFEVQYCNKACAEKKGLIKEEIIGQRILLNGFSDPTIKEIKFKQCRTVFETGEPIHYSYFSSYYEKYFMLSHVKVNEGILVTSRDLTMLYTINEELKRHAEDHERLAEQFNKIINASANGIVTLSSIRDEQGEIIDFMITQCNEQGFRMGRLPKNAVGKKLLDVLPQLKDIGYFDIHKKVIETGEAFSAELPFNSDNTTEGWYIVSLQKLDDGLVSNFIDVTHIREVERRAMQNARELDAIFHTSLSGMYVGEAIRNEEGEVIDLRFLRVNQTFSTLTGRSEEYLLNTSLLTISPITRELGMITHLKNVLETGHPARDVLYYHHIERWFEFSMVKMDAGKVTVSFSDITPLKKKENELEKTIAALRRSNENLEEFTRAASHDLKEPVRKVSFFGDLLKQRMNVKMNQDELQLLERMQTATSQMKLLIDDLLEYAHVGSHSQTKEDVDLNSKLKLILVDLSLFINEKNAVISIAELPVVKGYSRQLQQLFQNLVSNSLKYSREGVYPEISITAAKIKGIDAGMEIPRQLFLKEFYLIEVKDNGIGFEQSDAERIFNVFTRLHGNHDYSGTGVGLSIVRKVVENHEGFIAAHGEPGKGSTFKILLPY